MRRVRVAHRIAPIRPIPPRAAPFRPPPIRAAPFRPPPLRALPPRQAPIPVAPVFIPAAPPNQPIHHRNLTQQRPPVAPRLPTAVRNQPPPVLDAPLFPRVSGYDFEDDDEHEYEEVFDYPPTLILDQYGRITRRLPTYRSSQYYPQQRTTRRVRPRHH